jgi:hypothetical protein
MFLINILSRSGRFLITILIVCVTISIIFVSNKSKILSLQYNYDFSNHSSELLTARADLSFKLNMAMRKIGQLNCKMANSKAAVAQTGIFISSLNTKELFFNE